MSVPAGLWPKDGVGGRRGLFDERAVRSRACSSLVNDKRDLYMVAGSCVLSVGIIQAFEMDEFKGCLRSGRDGFNQSTHTLHTTVILGGIDRSRCSVIVILCRKQ